jgi:hypothetical protein
LTTTDSLIADLEAGLAAARALDRQAPMQPPVTTTAPVVDTSMMPGGADSAPVSAAEPDLNAPLTPESAAEFMPTSAALAHAAETEGLDLIDKLKDGKTVKEVAGLLHDVESSTAVESIVKAISDIAQGVRI